jgi:hypothetical protein
MYPNVLPGMLASLGTSCDPGMVVIRLQGVWPDLSGCFGFRGTGGLRCLTPLGL